MSEPYLGEIRMFGGNYAPDGWALCNGQILNIADNEALFTLIGTSYGGDGQNTFALPDLQGRVPIHPSSNYNLGAKGGTETVTLTSDQLPRHTHTPAASSIPGTEASPTGAVWAAAPTNSYAAGGTLVSMSSQAISSVGGSGSHENMMPSCTISFIIALVGIFPSQN